LRDYLAIAAIREAAVSRRAATLDARAKLDASAGRQSAEQPVMGIAAAELVAWSGGSSGEPNTANSPCRGPSTLLCLGRR
jgi:hypothetical protein